jgi:hypothetical protein
VDPFFQTLGFGFKTRGCWTRVINGLFFKFLEDKSKRFKTNLTLSMILRFNLRLGGYSIWSASFIAPHIKEDFKTIRGMSTSQPRSSQGSLGRHLQDGVQENSKTPSEVLGSLQYSTTKSRRLVRPGAMELCIWCRYSRIRDGTWLTPYTSCNYSQESRTSQNRRNYPSCTRVGLLSYYRARIFI